MDILLKERLVSYYEKHILEDVMPFWDRRCIDKEYGGYITCFDREGKQESLANQTEQILEQLQRVLSQAE